MLYREAQVADIPQHMVVRMAVRENQLSNPDRVTEQDNIDYLTKRGNGWVCEADDQIVGFAIADLQDHSIWALFVHPDYEQQGIGRQLQALMLRWYFSHTQHPIWLSTSPGTRAERFYRKSGWREAGRTASGEVRFELKMEEWARRFKQV
ncbi:GCN5-related N-acetyltransferase [Hymenobacter roseosalivarius DSM 11622]|uniref:GCN5-related N-acetyltransferase n=1 Tax=Hymenobacter roseosalivarius DSM 11622 TaxID=645990 RepID=A0A1W1VI62_9BACT|nr:GNAT family N-acetyltransferase [Hymenobacter roseosalivarius]SMB92963.1 GCN5-related N-acetyltransferase [Hymenobacter roseosalivarius DSM 11622]